MSAKTIPVLLDECWRNLVEKDDRMSPEEYADMALITKKELGDYLARAALSTPTEGPASAEDWLRGMARMSSYPVEICQKFEDLADLIMERHNATA